MNDRAAAAGTTSATVEVQARDDVTADTIQVPGGYADIWREAVGEPSYVLCTVNGYTRLLRVEQKPEAPKGDAALVPAAQFGLTYPQRVAAEVAPRSRTRYRWHKLTQTSDGRKALVGVGAAAAGLVGRGLLAVPASLAPITIPRPAWEALTWVANLLQLAGAAMAAWWGAWKD